MTYSVKFLAAVSAFVFALALAPAGARAGDPVADGRKRAGACVGCHGKGGVSPYPNIPNLAGQDRGYLVAQLKELRRLVAPAPQPAARAVPGPDTVMCRLADRLSDTDIDNLAAYYASLPCPAPSAAAAVSATIPAGAWRCAECHGPAAAGKAADIPYIGGQKQAYLENQLRAFRGGPREPVEPERQRERRHSPMEPQAKPLGNFEIQALARYFAARSCR